MLGYLKEVLVHKKTSKCPHQPKVWLTNSRIQERMEALNENARSEPPMVQKDDTTQLLLQILNNQDGRMKKLEQTVSNTDQNVAALIQGMSQKIITKGIEIGQGSS